MNYQSMTGSVVSRVFLDTVSARLKPAFNAVHLIAQTITFQFLRWGIR